MTLSNQMSHCICKCIRILYTLLKTPFLGTVDLILIVKSDIIIIVMNTDKKINFLLKIHKNSKN